MTLQNSSARRSRWLWLLALGVPFLGLAACYPGGPETASDTDIVVTVEVPESDYTNLLTYYLDPEVYDLTPPDEPTTNPIPQATKDKILEFLVANMAAAGFDSVAEDANPQLALVTGAVVSEVWFYYYGWGGYYPPSWYYPPYYQTGSFDVGSAVWQLLDLRSNPPEGEPVPIWLSGLNGVLDNTSSTDYSRLEADINQAFRQSPYIQATPATR